jgi:hypothetical protein
MRSLFLFPLSLNRLNIDTNSSNSCAVGGKYMVGHDINCGMEIQVSEKRRFEFLWLALNVSHVVLNSMVF